MKASRKKLAEEVMAALSGDIVCVCGHINSPISRTADFVVCMCAIVWHHNEDGSWRTSGSLDDWI